MNYGFVIDNRSCIGCHACSTACKAENQVPLGVNRTWVKVVDKGAWPDARRHFQVTRCNHCANPPCVTICPVTAMYQREDGIVDFDPEACIGCKACMQACPYDAIYVDPNSGTAAKCHYCAHRTDLGLEPACVVVCPTHAIVAGDLDDPKSEIAQLVARESAVVRKPEQGTLPKLFYIEADEVTLSPSTGMVSSALAFTDLVGEQALVGDPGAREAQANGRPPRGDRPATAPSGARLRDSGATDQGAPEHEGPIFVGGSRAGHMVQTAYTAQHKVPWHWPVPAYLVTKAIASGVGLILALLFGLGAVPVTPTIAIVGGLTAMVALGATTVLLVADLERPERFLRVITRPQWRSWLTRGAYILIAYSVALGAWLIGELLASGPGPAAATWAAGRPWLLAIIVPLAVATAVYTAFLFGQAEGRDLWQSPLLPGHLVVQAVMGGAAGLLLVLAGLLPALGAVVPGLRAAAQTGTQWLDAGAGGWLVALLIGALIIDLGLGWMGELGMHHASSSAARAAHEIRAGRYAKPFWLGAVLTGHVLPLVLLIPVSAGMLAGPAGVAAVLIASAAALAGLYAYEHVFVMAPQRLPNS